MYSVNEEPRRKQRGILQNPSREYAASGGELDPEEIKSGNPALLQLRYRGARCKMEFATSTAEALLHTLSERNRDRTTEE